MLFRKEGPAFTRERDLSSQVRVCPAKAALRQDLGAAVGEGQGRGGERHGQIHPNEFQMPPSPIFAQIDTASYSVLCGA